MVNSNNKDHSMLLTTHLLVNLDEFDGVKRSEVADLKRAITQDSINERKAYAQWAKDINKLSLAKSCIDKGTF